MRGLADAARGHVEDAAEADGVARVMDNAQIGDDVLDLAPLVEPRRPDQPVGHPRADERLFQRAGLGVGAVHHRAAVAVIALQHQVLNGIDDGVGLVALVVCFAHDELGPALAFGEELLGHVVGVALDDAHSRVEDDLRRAIVLLQHNRPRRGEVAVEVLDVAIVRATPLVDRLVGIAHSEDVVVVAGQLAQQAILRGVGVLELVDEDVVVALLVLLQHVRPLVEQQHRLHQQVVKVHGVVGLQGQLVVFVDAPGDLADVVGGLIGRRSDQVVLGRADAVEHLVWRELLVVQPQLGQRGLDDLKLVGRVEDDEVALIVG